MSYLRSKGERKMFVDFTGTLVNAAAIIAGSAVGLVFKGGIPEKVNDTLIKGLGLCVIFIGISGALKGNDMLVLIVSIALGGIIGELIDIDSRLKEFGDNLEKKLKGKGGRVSEAFVTSSLLFCVGAMAIVGALESGLTGNHEKLFTKSMLDGISSIIFASSLGVGVIFSAAAVFVYQGIITLGASALKGVLVTSVINDMTAVGSILIIGIGLNMLGSSKVKTANFLPAIFLPILYYLIMNIFV